ncbi:hypothetical protein, partial [Collinsella aerofaciens]|uniref:hypothetical protein n=1 Tax=Collinsella aerofaciens TaxID=74426 RepID=UPI001E6359DD
NLVAARLRLWHFNIIVAAPTRGHERGSYLFSALGLGHSVCRYQNIGVVLIKACQKGTGLFWWSLGTFLFD